MSAVQAAMTVVASPLPSPTVVKEMVTTTVPAQVPAVVVQAVQIGGIFVASLAVSVIHRIAEWLSAKEKGWGLKVNTLVATLYSFGIGVAGTTAMGQLGMNVSALVALAISTFTAFSGSFWTYAVRKVVADLTGKGVSVDSTPALNQDAAPTLAVEQPPQG